MRKIIHLSALAGLAFAASADAQVTGSAAAASPCGYSSVDTDSFPELAQEAVRYRYLA